jgi:hypothetical protein
MEMPVEKVITAVNSLDLKLLSLENVEILQRMVPTDQEVKHYRSISFVALFLNLFDTINSLYTLNLQESCVILLM